MIIAIVLTLAAAVSFAINSAVQQRAVKQQEPHRTLDPRFFLRLVRSRMWLASWIPDAIGTLLQGVALRFGTLVLVQSLLVSGLFLAIPLEAALDRRRPDTRDLVSVGIGALALVGFLILSQPRAGVPDPSGRAWVAVLAASGAAVAACVIGARAVPEAARGAILGIATGLLFGLAAALGKVAITKFSHHPVEVFTDWHVYVLVPVGILAFLLNQNAFQNGPLAASLTALTLADPVVSTIIAITAFREHLATSGPRLAVEIVAVLVMAIGIWLASTSHSHSMNRRKPG